MVRRSGIAGAQEMQMGQEAVEGDRTVDQHGFGQFERDAKRLHFVLFRHAGEPLPWPPGVSLPGG